LALRQQARILKNISKQLLNALEKAQGCHGGISDSAAQVPEDIGPNGIQMLYRDPDTTPSTFM
jgi:hypothetical protein